MRWIIICWWRTQSDYCAGFIGAWYDLFAPRPHPSLKRGRTGEKTPSDTLLNQAAVSQLFVIILKWRTCLISDWLLVKISVVSIYRKCSAWHPTHQRLKWSPKIQQNSYHTFKIVYAVSQLRSLSLALEHKELTQVLFPNNEGTA